MLTRYSVMAVLTGTTLLGSAVGSVDEKACNREAQRVGSASGDVVIVSVPVGDGIGTDMVLFVDDTNATLPDGNADRVFRLQIAGAAPENFRRRFSDVRVDWNPAAVTVVDPAGQTMTFEVGEPDRSSRSSTFYGYGFSQTVGWQIELPGGDPTEAEYSELIRAATPTDNDCSEPGSGSGGKGSTTCEQGCPGGSSCSVSCDGDYYACCGCYIDERAECRCVPIEPS